MEELLEKARRDYPAGTVFKSAFNPDRKGKVTHLNFFVENENIFTDQLYDDLAEEGIGEAIYYEGVWAKIISNPKVKEDMNEFLGLPKEETMTLLAEAKRRFPVGTKFVPAHFLEKNDDYYCIIVEDGEFVERENESIFQAINGIIWDDGEEDTSRYGNTWWDRMLYHQGKWARIIEEPKTRMVESLNECKAEDPHSNANLAPGKARVVRTFGQIKEDNFFKTATESLCKMLEAKNKAYGESALKPLDIFAKHHPYGSRLDEKLARIKNSEELRKNDVADIIGGLLLICKDKGWDDFTDLID